MSGSKVSCPEAAATVLRNEIKRIRKNMTALKKPAAKGDKNRRKQIEAALGEAEGDLESKQTELRGLTEKSVKDASPQKELVAPAKTGKMQRAAHRRWAKDQRRARAEHEASRYSRTDRQEDASLQSLLDSLELSVYSIDADGHCLFRALCHQLEMQYSRHLSVWDMRAIAADHILKNREKYSGFVLDAGQVDEGQTEDAFVAYCEKIRTTTMWGGHVELDALSEALQAPIHVYQSEFPVVKFGPEGEKPLRLCFKKFAFSLGEHYDSLVPIKS